MVIPTTNGETMYLDGILQGNLEFVKEIIKKNWDILFVIDGVEGGGKSLFARQLAYFCDPTFIGDKALDRICFTPKEFKKAIMESEKYQSIIFDECFRGLSSRASVSKVNKLLTQLLMEIRAKNLIVFLVLPSFFELDKYPAIHRSLGLFHVKVGDNWERGFFKYYDSEQKKKMYLRGKKDYSYCAKHSFRGRFTKSFDPIDEKKYDEKKEQSLKTIFEDELVESKYETRYREKTLKLIEHLLEVHNYTHKDISKILDVERSAITDFLLKHKKDNVASKESK